DVVSARIGQSVGAASCLATVPASTTTTTTATTTTTTTTRTTTSSTSATTSTSTTSTTSTSATTATTSTTTSTTSTTTAPTTSTTLPAVPGGDGDGDGVPDARDACAGTPPGDLVDTRGCSVCPCDGPRGGGGWPARSAYLHCVRGEARLRVALGVLGRRE